MHLGDPAVRERVVQRVSAITPETPSRWGRMNAHGMICHLSDSFRGAMGTRYVSPATGMLQRTVMKWGALYLPMRWPKGVPTRPEVDQNVGGSLPGDFQHDRTELVALIRRFTAADRSFTWGSHPFFGPLREQEWLRWAYLHTDHHLRQFGL